jgi:non-ribosomal peptide synthetase component F
MEAAREWYAKTFCDAADTDSLPIPEAELQGEDGYIYKSYPLTISKEDILAIEKRFGTKESVIMQAAWALLLAAYSAEEKASYCTAFFGRTDRRTLSSVTMMVHTLPVFLDWGQKAKTIGELLAETESQLQQTQQYQYYAYQDAVRDLGLNNQVMFVYQGSVLADKRGSLHLNGETLPFIDLKKPTPGWKLSAELFEHDNTYSLALCHNTADYTDEYLQQLARTYSTILRSMVSAEW